MGSVSIIPMLLKHRTDKSGKSQIVIRVYQSRQVVCSEKISQKVSPLHWDDVKREVSKISPSAYLLNSLIKRKVAELEEKFLQAELLGVAITKNALKRIATGQFSGKDYMKFVAEVVPIKYAKPEQAGTRRQHLGEINKLKEFREHVDFGDIDFKFLSEYKAWMITKKKNKDNTVWKTFKAMNAMLNEAIKMGGYIVENPFKHFNRGTCKEGTRAFLEIGECDKIYGFLQTDIPERLRLVGYYYLFMCYSGLRFQDAINLFDYDKHVIDNRIVMETQKTGEDVTLFIHDRLRKVLDFVRVNKLSSTNVDFNRHLKLLAAYTGITSNLSSHTGRHTFGAMMAEMNVPIERAQKLLGHRNSKTTKIYYHIKDRSLDDEMMKWDKI